MSVCARPAEGHQGERRRYVQRRPAPRDQTMYESRRVHPAGSLATLIERRVQASDAIRQISAVSADSSFTQLKIQKYRAKLPATPPTTNENNNKLPACRQS